VDDDEKEDDEEAQVHEVRRGRSGERGSKGEGEHKDGSESVLIGTGGPYTATSQLTWVWICSRICQKRQ
jgi:hypothetical protein